LLNWNNSFPPDDGATIAMELFRVTPVIGVSDGSASHRKGTHAWKLCQYPNGPDSISGTGPIDVINPSSFRVTRTTIDFNHNNFTC
jgi:hypothetical protein